MKVRLAVASAVVLFVGVLTMAPVSAQYVGGEVPKAGPVAGQKVASPVVEAEHVATPVDVHVGRTVRTTRFALTGADIAQMVLIAGALILGGAVLVRQGRRRVAPSGS